MLRPLLAAVAVLTVAPAALAGPVAEVLGPDGKLVAAAGSARFDYPKNGALVHVGTVSVTSAGVELGDVSLLGGRIQAIRVVVPPKAKSAHVDGLYVDGRAVRTHVNRLIPLTGADYLITSQAAVGTGRRVGVVGLRLSLGDRAFGYPAGTQVLVGLPASPKRSSPLAARRTPSKVASPLAVLGFTGGAALAALPPASFFPTGTLGQKAVSIAERYLGVPYVWAGANPLTGFDCSGFVMFVYGQLGIQLTHYTGSQIHEGTPVPPGALRPGDIVFFFSHGGVPGHEGMYIGNGMFIQAPHTGDVVKISSLRDPEYALGYMGAVRPYGN